MRNVVAKKQWLAFLWLVQCFFATNSANAQSPPPPTTSIQPQTDWGGQLVHEILPHQPEVIFVQPGQDQTPIYLDQLPEFCPPATPAPNEIFLLNPPAQNTDSQLPPGVRGGLFQKLFFTGSWLPQLEGDSLGFSDLETGIVLGLPFFRVTAPLLITPRFAVHYLEGPAAPDLPARLYDTDITFRHLRKFGDGPWAMNVAITLGYYSDFEKNDADAFRLTGQAFAVYESSPATTWVFGVVYLNRENLSVVPAAGVIYKPTPDVKYEAIFPRPRIAWRLPGGSLGSNSERWAYLGGEFGGGVWSIQRPISLAQDLLTYNDYRLLIGLERKVVGGLSRRLEAGYVFGRELEFASATPDVELEDTLFLRAGLTY